MFFCFFVFCFLVPFFVLRRKNSTEKNTYSSGSGSSSSSSSSSKQREREKKKCQFCHRWVTIAVLRPAGRVRHVWGSACVKFDGLGPGRDKEEAPHTDIPLTHRVHGGWVGLVGHSRTHRLSTMRSVFARTHRHTHTPRGTCLLLLSRL